MKKKIGIRKAAELLLSADNIQIFTHMRPDFDTVGSALALRYALRKLGKNADFCCSDRLSDRFLLVTDRLDTEPMKKADFVVCVDMATDVMLGKYKDAYASKVNLSIDHHLSNCPYAEYTVCRSDASATGELIFDLCRLLGVKQDKTLAKYLYCAISSDSGCFKYSNTSPKTHRIAAKLLEYDIDAAYLNRKMLDVRSKAQLELEKMCLDEMRYYAGSRVAVMPVTLEMCEKAGADVSDVDALVQIPRMVDGVEVGITLKEQETGKFKVSVRSNDSFDATELAGIYGGGGHIRASGFTVTGECFALCDEIAKKTEELL